MKYNKQLDVYNIDLLQLCNKDKQQEDTAPKKI